MTKATSTRIRIFLNPHLFLSGYGLGPHVSDASGILIRSPELKFLNTVWIRNRVFAKSGYIKIFFIRWRNKIEPGRYLEYCIQDGKLVPRASQCKIRCKVRALYDGCSVANFPRGVLGTSMNPDTCGHGNFWIQKEKVADSNSHTNYFCENWKKEKRDSRAKSESVFYWHL